jgi:ABC-type nitrate/sulfonate/bicarbonate transport system ATPase subunit
MTSARRAPIIVATGVGKGFSRSSQLALTNVNLEIRSGEFLCLVGPSGCGKSTFLFMVAGLVPLSVGRLEIDGVTINGPSRDRGLVFQESALFPWLSVRDNIAFGLNLDSSARSSREQKIKLVVDLIRLVGLQGFEAHRPHELSGGMKQRTAIAACLAIEPKVLLMDEPFAALDAQTRAILQRELLRIHESSGRTTLFVTHDIREAIILSDRVAVMSARPGTIKAIIDIDLPRPRWQIVAERHPRFLELERQLADLLEHDIRDVT